MRKIIVAGFTALMIGIPVAPAMAAPLDPCQRDATECERSNAENVGPGNRDWYCTYNWTRDHVECAYAPGNGSSTGRLLVERAPFAWYNPWTWF